MNLDPREIENVKFSTTRLREGYEQEEVDAFLDRVAASLTAALDDARLAGEECRKLRARVETLERPQGSPESPGVAAERLLTFAQQTADDVVEQARGQAAELKEEAEVVYRGRVRDAELESAALITDATEKAGSISDDAERKAHERRRQAEASAYKAEEALRELAEVKERTVAQLREQLDKL